MIKAPVAKYTGVYKNQGFVKGRPVSKEEFLKHTRKSYIAMQASFGNHEISQELLDKNDEVWLSRFSNEAEVMEAEVASEGRAAKKPAKKAEKKIDKRKTPEFIAHLRKLAQARKEKAAAERLIKQAQKKAEKVAVVKVDKKQVKKAAQENKQKQAVKTGKKISA